MRGDSPCLPGCDDLPDHTGTIDFGERHIGHAAALEELLTCLAPRSAACALWSTLTSTAQIAVSGK